MSISDESRIWATLAWALSLVGAIIALLMRANDDYVKYWAIESLGLTVIAIIGDIVLYVLTAILGLLGPLAIISTVLYALFALGIFLIWVVGLLKAWRGDRWNPPFVHNVAMWISRTFSL